jgi:hypothetical protein
MKTFNDDGAATTCASVVEAAIDELAHQVRS